MWTKQTILFVWTAQNLPTLYQNWNYAIVIIRHTARNLLHHVGYNIIDSQCFSFNKLLLQKEELEQRHLHLLQVVESEMTAKWQYTQQCDELESEIKKLRAEVKHKIINELLVSAINIVTCSSQCLRFRLSVRLKI